MHLLIISMICCTLLFIQGYAKPSYECEKNVPPHVREIILKIINDTHPEKNPPYKLNYVCGTGKKAFRQRQTDGALREIGAFDGESDFNFNWEESLSNAVQSAGEDKVALIWGLNATRIGCGIRLSTDKVTGIHNLRLSCSYDRNAATPTTISPEV